MIPNYKVEGEKREISSSFGWETVGEVRCEEVPRGRD